MESFDNRFTTQVDFKWLEGYQKQEIKYKRSKTSTYFLAKIDHPTLSNVLVILTTYAQ